MSNLNQHEIMQEKAEKHGISISELKERIVEAWLLQEQRAETVEEIRLLQQKLEVIDERLDFLAPYQLNDNSSVLFSPSKITSEGV